MPPTPELISLARAAAARHALDPALVCAVVEQESSWDAHAIRYESAFRSRYVAPLGLPPTEEVARSISWGLMQVMGQVAREHGFHEPFLSALCEPATGLDVGCAVLAAKLAAARSRPPVVIPNPAAACADGGEGSAPDFGSENQQRIPQTSSCAPTAVGENQTTRDSAPDDSVQAATRMERQGSVATEIAHALELWNGGANPDYAALVLARLAHYR
ncbi:MAG TPA: transglycosylase SLT domain-containing protein [Candidatus Acidoferrales bacterium]|nr:transglycosylase SLT domain-containing protein [Candidatus Acidoferrales bacterium]